MSQKYFFDPATLTYESVDKPKYVRILRVAGLVLACAVMVVFYFWLFFSVFGITMPKSAYLKAEHTKWETRINLLDRQLDMYAEVLSGIEERDDYVYRSIYGLNSVPAGSEAGLASGGPRYDYLDENGANSNLKRAVMRMDDLEKRAYIRSRTLDEADAVSKEAGEMISCVPAVPPIMPVPGTFNISSEFGGRVDPVYGGQAFHSGQDFATKKGTPVYATGDGVVEKAEFQFSGYGNVVIINHGYGYKTLYAHLNTIEILEGMKISRGEKLGTVGKSGKATGSHLHYEVHYRGERVNPRGFYDIKMPVEEYRAMVKTREEESGYGKKISTSEVIRRTRTR